MLILLCLRPCKLLLILFCFSSSFLAFLLIESLYTAFYGCAVYETCIMQTPGGPPCNQCPDYRGALISSNHLRLHSTCMCFWPPGFVCHQKLLCMHGSHMAIFETCPRKQRWYCARITEILNCLAYMLRIV